MKRALTYLRMFQLGSVLVVAIGFGWSPSVVGRRADEVVRDQRRSRRSGAGGAPYG